MAKKAAFIDSEKCNPVICDKGICQAKTSCPRKIIKQAEPYEVPFVYATGDLCGGCFLCIKGCPLGAISKI